MALFRYVALGDSSAVGVGADSGGGYPERIFQALKRGGFPAGIVNLGISGATSADLLGGPLSRALSLRPHLVTLGIGTNDLWRMVAPETFAVNVERIAGALAGTGADVLVCNLIDLALAPAAAMAQQWLGIPPGAFTERAAAFNEVLAQLTARHGFTGVDLFSFSRRELPGHPEYFCADGFHPSALGYERWAALCLPAAEQAARRWSAHGAAAERSTQDTEPPARSG